MPVDDETPEVAASLGRSVIAFEELAFAVRAALAELVCQGDTSGDAWDRARRVDTLIGHMSFNARVEAVGSIWAASSLSVPLDRALLAELRSIEAERNRLVHSSWLPPGSTMDDGGHPVRIRFERRSGRFTGRPMPVDEVDEFVRRTTLAVDLVWQLHGAAEQVASEARRPADPHTGPARDG